MSPVRRTLLHRNRKPWRDASGLLRFGSRLLAGVAALCLWMLWEHTSWATDRQQTAPAHQAEEYAAHVPKTIVELQQFRQTHTIEIETAEGQKQGVATLINLNPTINVWYLLGLSWQGSASAVTYHLENSNPMGQKFLLDKHIHGLLLAEGAHTLACALWTPSQQSLEAARRSRITYAPLCNGQLYLRNPTKGHRTALETTTDLLRDKVWGGEKLIGFVRDTFFEDAYQERAEVSVETHLAVEEEAQLLANDSPVAAVLDPKYANRVVMPPHLGIEIARSKQEGVISGRWYTAQENPGIYVSVLQPQSIAPEILRSHATVVKPLDSVEAAALVYVVAFDLKQFDLGFALGADHPRVGWSERVLERAQDKTLPGSDGIGSIAPLVATGRISPTYASRTVATFTGGFKRAHGAFKYGALALMHHGSHYGFIEQGVVFSKLQPGLATLVVRDDGWMEMKTWTAQDNAYLARIKHARQNGVPLIEFDATTQSSVPGPLVGQWGPGNWSGSQDKQLRALRAGACVQEQQGQRFLLYAYFSSATPSAMVRVFQAYRCRYAMLLDMNALEHTYLAVYRRQGEKLLVQHLIQGMSALDKSEAGQYVPRFLGYADNRDFFYVMRRAPGKEMP